MKTMTCKQLGGPCDMEFHANTFEEMVDLSKKHGMEMFQKGEKAHIQVMQEMKEKMKSQSSEEMQKWMESRKELFNTLAEDS